MRRETAGSSGLVNHCEEKVKAKGHKVNRLFTTFREMWTSEEIVRRLASSRGAATVKGQVRASDCW